MTAPNPTQTDKSSLTDEQLGVVTKVTIKMMELGLNVKFIPNISVGPIISIYRFLPQGSTRVSMIEALADDFAVVLGVEDVMVKRMPGESAVGIMVPNKNRTIVKYLDTATAVWKANQGDDCPTSGVPLGFGVDHLGNPFVEDLTALPHLLIAGSTGSGKSTLVSSILASLIFVKRSNEVKLILSDTKNVEFGHFIGAPHLLFTPATSVYQTMEQMEWLVDEMDKRLKTIGSQGCRNIFEYKEKANAIERLQNTGFPCSKAAEIPFIILVIDELADILGDRSKSGDKGPGIGKVAEGLLAKIVQKSRAAGVYVIAATQRPSVNIVSGSIKANFPARLSFRLPSGHDSRTVLGIEGAEHLLSRGDMMYVSPNRPGISRLHAPWASIQDINNAVEAAIQRERMEEL